MNGLGGFFVSALLSRIKPDKAYIHRAKYNAYIK